MYSSAVFLNLQCSLSLSLSLSLSDFVGFLKIARFLLTLL
jgi:hypothetical protein